MAFAFTPIKYYNSGVNKKGGINMNRKAMDMEYKLGALGDTLNYSQSYMITNTDKQGEKNLVMLFMVKGLVPEYSIVIPASTYDKLTSPEIGSEHKAKIAKCEFNIPNEISAFKDIEMPFIFFKNGGIATGVLYTSDYDFMDQRVHIFLAFQKGENITLKVDGGITTVRINGENFWNKANMKRGK